MGMPIIVEITDDSAENSAQENNSFEKNAKPEAEKTMEEIFNYFREVDEKFSPFKKNSELMKINTGALNPENASAEMKEVFALSEETRQITKGYFNIELIKGVYDPSGLVKGWAIWNASKILASRGFKNFYISAGGDIQAQGRNSAGKPWNIGIKNPFNPKEIVKIICTGGKSRGIATSGTYEQGQHIYNPLNRASIIKDIVSLTVVGPNIYEADRFATAAFAMGGKGINFIENTAGLEGYMIDKNGTATQTSGFTAYANRDNS